MENLKIYLADDDQDDRELFQDAFNELDSGNELRLFKDGIEVIDHLEAPENIPDILFLDLNMPKLGGLETVKKIRKEKRYERLSIVIYSTSSVAQDMQAALAAGANAYVIKPNSFQCLKDTLRNIIKRTDGNLLPL